MNIAIIGSGYVGLITGLCLSKQNNIVRCIDLNTQIVENINNGIPHFFEEGLNELLADELEAKRFKALSSLENIDIEIELIIIAVGTPSDNSGDIDLSYIEEASKNIGKFIKKNKHHISIVIKSTVLPTTTDLFVRQILEDESSKKVGDFGLGMNPEFLREGSAIKDFLYPDRVVIGWEDKKTKERLEKLYSPWDCEKIIVNSRTAELIKYTNNCFLALQISASNEFANLAYKIGNIDIEDVMSGLNLDKRWNPKKNGKRLNPGILNYLKSGCGFGGSCFPKDVKAIRNYGIKKGLKMEMARSIININNRQPAELVKIMEEIDNLEKLSILILGLSFKENTDDIRESPAIQIIKQLRNKVKKIFAHDPMAIENFTLVIPPQKKLEYVKNWENFVTRSDVILVLNGWKNFKKLENFDLRKKYLIDPRRVFNKSINVKKYLTIGLNNKS